MTESDRKEFYEAGYSKQTVLDVVLLFATKIMSNYANHIAETPLDKSMEAFAWTKP